MSGFASKLYTAEQVRCLDACAIHEHGIPADELMKRAGKAVFDAATSRFPSAASWAVVCGAGNNAGDGYVIAGLALETGKSVRLYALTPPEKLKGEARTAAQDFLKGNGVVHGNGQTRTGQAQESGQGINPDNPNSANQEQGQKNIKV